MRYYDPATCKGTGRGFLSAEGRGGAEVLAPSCLLSSSLQGDTGSCPDALGPQGKGSKTNTTKSTGFQIFFFSNRTHFSNKILSGILPSKPDEYYFISIHLINKFKFIPFTYYKDIHGQPTKPSEPNEILKSAVRGASSAPRTPGFKCILFKFI